MVILSFCGFCGVLLPAGLGNKPPELQRCENCHNNVSDRKDRSEGTFNDTDAHKLCTVGDPNGE